jgi:hypothetical protein
MIRSATFFCAALRSSCIALAQAKTMMAISSDTIRK